MGKVRNLSWNASILWRRKRSCGYIRHCRYQAQHMRESGEPGQMASPARIFYDLVAQFSSGGSENGEGRKRGSADNREGLQEMDVRISGAGREEPKDAEGDDRTAFSAYMGRASPASPGPAFETAPKAGRMHVVGMGGSRLAKNSAPFPARRKSSPSFPRKPLCCCVRKSGRQPAILGWHPLCFG